VGAGGEEVREELEEGVEVGVVFRVGVCRTEGGRRGGKKRRVSNEVQLVPTLSLEE
jgi:hypothetical protein